jgi:hypothetical protein
MTIKHLIYIFIIANIFNSCADKPTNKYFGVQIKNYGPTGSVYTDTAGKQFGFRAMSFEITNDTLVPVKLQIELPNEFVALKPFTDNKYKVFLLPGTMTRDKQYDFATNNHQVSKILEKFLNKELYPTILKKVIQPGETYLLRLGFLFNPGGAARAELFSKGHQLKLYIPKEEIKFNNTNRNELEIVLGVTLDYRNSSTISCGKLSY